ncbi:cbb3-type cytochrome oxidase assembly protein CcoS [Aliidiomarina halalkaliphila]|uniref:Cbb3-type cytochrome oxidase assembly protein CcoS n=1 Tax=Aliidiomarina halalkaliphila TaxID=2593535 RepID=A0A552X4C3_9GAMM|nr:cbb3-type cytochrome oxidase assembly protein CcoS [Aliidiomarina halalkaliphila]TRW49759.1 cbb3-type cytochrome oxidase assembly protein CcoS [Aliidiomarina halalkaliphila]
MEILHLMVPIAIILVIIAIALFFWAVRTGQFDDLERQGYNILLDDESKKKPQKNDTADEKTKQDSPQDKAGS